MVDFEKLKEDMQKAKQTAENPVVKEMRRLLENSIPLALRKEASVLAKQITDNDLSLNTPKFEPPTIPKFKSSEEINEYNSAKSLLQRLNVYYSDWSAKIEADCEVKIYALLPNGAIITVKNLTQEGFNGIAVEGSLDDAECLLLTHQASLQFLCVAEKVTEETPRQKIGFVYQ